MAGTITRGKILRADLSLWDGKTATHSRTDATGGTVTGLRLGDSVDVLQVYGSGTDRTRATIKSATDYIASTAVTLVFAPGTWTIDSNLTISANFTCRIPAGCVFSVSSGVTLTFSGDVIVEDEDTWYSGAGTVVVSRESAHGGVWHRTSAERTAGVTPTNLGFPPGEFRRYGAVGDGVTNDATAIQRACSAGHKMRGGGPEFTYLVTSEITLPDTCDMDLEGATVKPSGNTRLFVKSPTGLSTLVVSPTVSSGATVGSRSVVVSSAASLAVGQWVGFESNDAGHSAGSWPVHWSKITSISGTTVEIDIPFKVTYAATVTMNAYSSDSFKPLCKIVGGVLDLSASTYSATTGQALRVSGYQRVDIDLRILNADDNSANTCPLEIFNCLSVKIQGQIDGGISQAQMIDLQSVRDITIPELQINGGGFGLEIVRADDTNIGNILIRGRRKMERDGDQSSTSVRGLKIFGCPSINVNTVSAHDLTSGIKIESNFRGNIANIICVNCVDTTGDAAVNFSGSPVGNNQFGWNISNIVIENSGGIGLAIAQADEGRFNVANIYTRNTGSSGIYSNGVGEIQIANAYIENWGTAGAAYGIRSLHGISIQNATFRNTDTTRVCINRASWTAGQVMAFGLLRNPDNCDLFDSAEFIETTGTATIASGSTSVVVTHDLIRTPTAAEIVLTPTEAPTNNVGAPYVTSITSSQFTIAVRSDPGASGYDISWRAAIKMPFTV